jgi:hypothetical protein
MRQFIHQDDRGFAFQRRVDVEFRQHRAPVFDRTARDHFDAFKESFCFLPGMGLNHTGNNVGTL